MEFLIVFSDLLSLIEFMVQIMDSSCWVKKHIKTIMNLIFAWVPSVPFSCFDIIALAQGRSFLIPLWKWENWYTLEGVISYLKFQKVTCKGAFISNLEIWLMRTTLEHDYMPWKCEVAMFGLTCLRNNKITRIKQLLNYLVHSELVEVHLLSLCLYIYNEISLRKSINSLNGGL